VTRHRAPAVELAAALILALAACAAPRLPPAEQLARSQRAGGETASRFDDPATAATLYGRAARSAAEGDQPHLAADAACREGLARLAAGEPSRALAPLARAAALARDAGDRPLAARALLGLARARQAAGEPGVAEALGEARALAGDADPVAAALAEVGLGSLAATPAEAEARFATAQRLAGEAPEVAGPLSLNRARRAERSGDAAAARAAYRAALGTLGRTGDRRALLSALRAAARLAEQDPAGAAEAAALRRRADDVAAGLGRPTVP
jgi:hypothetical protein